MVKLYSDDKVIISNQEIITTATDMERVLILKENSKKSMDRRQFMMFSALLAGSMAFPTKAEAWFWFFIRPALSFVFRRRVTTAFVKNTVRLGNSYKNASKVNKVKQLKKVENAFKAKLGLTMNPEALYHASNTVVSKQTNIIWDRKGYHKSPKTGEVFQNMAWLAIENRTNNYIETAIKLCLFDGNSETHKRRYFLKVAPRAYSKIDVSQLYRELPRNGIQTIVYELETHQNDIRISSPNKRVYVTNLIV